MVSSELGRLLRRPGFTRYFFVVAAARATGVMFNVAGVLLILERTGDLALAGIVVAAATLPGAFTGPFLGGWLDVTKSRRRLLVFDRCMTALALVAVLLLAGHAPNWLLPLAGLLYGATSPLSAGAFSSVLPEIAGPELMNVANAFEGASINAAFIAGPALAGVLAATAGPAAAVEVQLVTGLILAGMIAVDETFELRPEHDEPPPDGIWHAVRQGLVATWQIVPLRWNLIIDAFYVLAWGMLNVGFPAYAVAVGAGAHASGYMWAAVSFGSLISGFAARGLTASLAPRVVMGGCFSAMAVSAAAWPLAGSAAVALVLIFVTGLFDGPGLIALIAIRQRLAPPHLRAQIFTTATSLHSAVIAAGAAGAGLLDRAAGTNATLLVFAGLIGLSAVFALISESGGRPNQESLGAGLLDSRVGAP
ncbi:MAG TPA: MFS transporter [Solirubrobacteraceae bacterium]|nr:MFS transporter [Solirubrobacteraceae bacterium]